MKDLKQFIKTTIRKFLTENKNDNINKLKQLYFKNGFSGENIINMVEEGYFKDIEWLDENTLIVYRSISLPESRVNKFKTSIGGGIGQYWSYNKNIDSIWGRNAEYEVGKNENIVDIRCKGYLNLEDIDFEDLRYAFNDDFHNFCDEQEIRGKQGGITIKLKKCFIT